MPNLLGAMGQAKPVSEFINTAGQYQTTQSNLESQRLSQQKQTMEIENARKEQEYNEQEVDFLLTPFYLSLTDDAKPIAEKMFQGAGAVNQNFRGKRRDMFRVVGEIEKSKGSFEALMKPVTDAKHNAAVKAYEKWVKSGDPKDEEAFKIARAQAETSKGEYFKHLDELEKERVKASNKPPILKNVPGVGLVQVTPGEDAEGTTAEIVMPSESGGGNDPSVVRTFEAAHPELAQKRGTPEYGEALQKFIQSGERPYTQFIGTTEDGTQGITFDSRKGTFGVQPLPGGKMPGPKTQQRMSEPVLKGLGKFRTAYQDIQQAREKFDENWVGPVTGRGREIAQAVRNDPKFESFRRTVGRLITIAYGLSGQQISDREIERLHNVLLPSIKQMDENMLTTLDELEDWVARNNNNELDYNKMSDYIVRDDMYLNPKKSKATGGKFKILKVE